MATLSGKQIAIVKKLYCEKQYTMKQIAGHFGVSLNAVVYCMRHHGIPRRTLKECSKISFDKKPVSFTLKGRLSQGERELKIIGVVLYWGEGYKKIGSNRNSTVDFANSDPEMIRAYVAFLRNICGVDETKLRVLLYCYANQNTAELIRFWSKLTKISPLRFSKPYVRNDFREDKIGRMPHGLVHIRYADKKLLQVMLRWIEEYKNKYQ